MRTSILSMPRRYELYSALDVISQHGWTNGGIGALDPNVTFGSTTVTPTFRYKFGDADATDLNPWGYGDILPIVEGGTAPTFNWGAPGLGSNDDSAFFNAGDYYAASDNNAGEITTEDIMLEVVYWKGQAGSTKIMLGKHNGSTQGWFLSTNGDLSFLVDDGPTSATVSSAALADGQWYIAHIFIDKSQADGMQCYINGAISGSSQDPTLIGDLTVSGALSMGSAAGLFKFTGGLAYAAMWLGAGWIAPGERAALVKTRAHKYFGTYWGKAPDPEPTSFTRATSAFLTKLNGSGDKTLHQVSAGYPRVMSTKDANSETISGYLAESAATNLCLRSQEFDSAWTPTRLTIGADSTTAPDGSVTADCLQEDGTAAQTHFLTQNITLTGSQQYTWTVYAKAVNRTWLALQIAHGDTTTCFFNIGAGVGATATPGNADKLSIEALADDWYRVRCTYTANSSGSKAHRIYPAEGDADVHYDGLSQDSIYAWGSQVENNGYPTSLVTTEGATATRNADVLVMPAGDNIGGSATELFTIEQQVLVPDETLGATSLFTEVSDGGSAVDRMITYYSGGSVLVVTVSTGESVGTANVVDDIADDEKANITTHIETDNMNVAIDGVFGTADSDAGTPDDLDQFRIGCDGSDANQANSILGDIKIKKK